MRLRLFSQEPDPYELDPNEPLAGTWRINDTPTMTGWDFPTQDSGIGKGPIYFTIGKDQEVGKYSYIDVTEDDKGYIKVCYWPVDFGGKLMYTSSTGVWTPSNANYINIKSTGYDGKPLSSNTRQYITAWLNANATKIS